MQLCGHAGDGKDPNAKENLPSGLLLRWINVKSFVAAKLSKLTAARFPEANMYKHILIASDGSQLADKALTQGLKLAQSLGARVTVLTASAPFPMPGYGTVPAATLIEAHERATTENAARILSAAGESAKKLDVICDTIHAKAREPAEAIVDTAQRRTCDLIVMASHGYHAVKRLLLGSVAIEVLTHSKVPVLIFRGSTT